MTKTYEQELAEQRAVARVQAMAIRLVNEKKISRSALCEKLEVSQARVSQILSGDPENISVRRAAALFHALGEELVLSCRGIDDLDRRARAMASQYEEKDVSY
jgi:transcriptional regulator with XRE-family HTH domain